MTESVVDCPCIALIAQLLVHKYYIKGAFVVNDIINSFIDQSEGVLVFELNLGVSFSQFLFNDFLLTEGFPDAHCKRD